MDNLHLDIARLHAAYAKGLSPAEVVDAVYARIEAANDPGIFILLLDKARVRAAAEALPPFDPASKPLWGVPFAVKDNIDVAGLPTTVACPAFAYTPSESAPCVELLLEAGAMLIGKTNLDQFATGLTGVRSPYPIPRNAIDPEIAPGGSSSGSYVAVARGLVSFALGTDTAGSGRVPAALNNIVGVKPSVGAVSTRGVFPACRTIDCVSVASLTVDDGWRVLTAMARYDPAEPYSRPVDLGRPLIPPALRIGIPSPDSLAFFGDAEAERGFRAHISRLEAMGATLVEFDLTPFRKAGELLYASPWVAERYQAIRSFIETRPEALFPITREIIAPAGSMSAADAFSGFYRLVELKRETEPLWRRIDMIAVPSVPTTPTLRDLEKEPIAANARMGTYTNFVNLLDLCALTVPGGFRDDGRPCGLTFIAERGRDGLLAAFGAKFHAEGRVPLGATGAYLPETEPQPPGAPPGWVELAVAGAHMSGLPLNRQLTERGAIFLRKAATAPYYRLFALAGGDPPRPGLLRVAQTENGRSIELELWALPVAAAGAFLADIPPPLAIGTISLLDGGEAKGFLAEAHATQGARDISEFGGWRAFLAAQSADGN